MRTAPNKAKPKFPSMMKRMDEGGPTAWQSANQWANKNQQGISAVGDYGAATIDALAPKDAYGVRSNGAAIGSGALSGAAKGAALGSAVPIIGTAAGAVVGGVIGGVTGLLGNEKANKAKIQSIQNNTINQLQMDQQASGARVAGDPSLKYGRMSASYYRFGGVMKNSPAVLPRTTKPLPAVQAKPRLMPNITESPNRQMSRMATGGQFGGLPNAIHNNATKLYRPTKPLKAQKNQILADGGSIHINPANKGKFNATKAATGKSTEELTHSSNPVTKKRAIFALNAAGWNKKADGGQVEQLSSQDTMINGPSHENGGVKFPNAGVELEGGETVNNGFVFSKKLGFAKPAAVIAGQLGKAEKRPETAINTSTVNALQRKTELLKVHQEAAKKEAGIPSDLPQMANGGPIMGSDTSRRSLPVIQNTTPTDMEKAFPIVTQSLLQQRGGTTGMQINTAPIDFTRKTRDFEMGTPGKNLPMGKEIPTIKSPTGRTYKFGGSMKKMDNGGNPWDTNPITGLINSQKTYTGNSSKYGDVNITAPALPQATPDPAIAAEPTPVQYPASKSSSTFNDIAGKVTPFLSNFVNATQKLPLPPVPQLNTEITPNLVDYSASRNEAVRANRSANASARTNLNSGAAVSAVTAANLAGQTRAVSQINEAENNQNASIRNSTAAENAQIRAGNTALQNNYQNELVQRQIKGQSLKSANMANLEEKVQGMAKDKKMFDLEGEKAILGFLSTNDTGAGYDAARPILQKHLSADQLQQMDTWASKMRADRAGERADNMKANKLQLDYLKNTKGTSGVLNGASAISTGKLKRTGTETDTDKEGNKTIKKTTALFN